jgi:metal-responsive CopG/Arc/MetJ family transcriptional regulator
MKTAVSVPDDVFAEAESVAKKAGMSRSELYVRALRVYLEASRDDRITAQFNAVYDTGDDAPDPFLERAAAAEARRG